MNLIPFALLLDTKLLIDVADVESGKKCGCICPSCKIPLIAKKGDINEWHFAHDSQYIEKGQELSCDFSWAVAVKMMIKQIFMTGTALTLPEYYIDFPKGDYHKKKQKIKVTERSTIHYNNPELKSFTCDVTIEVKGKKLGVLLLTKDSQIVADDSFDQALFGVIAISIDQVGYDDNGKVVNHLRDHLKILLESETRAKHWLFHRRERAAYKKAIEQEILVREKEKKEPIIASNVINKTSPILETVPWYCVSCQHEYQGYSLGLNPCPKCDSHFYRKML